MSKINFTCPHCSHTMQLPSTLLGKQGKCPSCRSVATITNVPDNPSLSPQQPLQQQPLPQQPLPQQPLQQQPLQQQPL
ncbi:MAG: hypothetical protein HOM32_04410, partial [Planctomycetaceae bacterium]|nr:hypothetical protein [Planctomycetaceae bacterium]